ncbi:MAG: hypothetical protein MJ215_02370 [Spirochaetia bacterium]|nr:hypothetical protein [Spirochaetia bacterium]
MIKKITSVPTLISAVYFLLAAIVIFPFSYAFCDDLDQTATWQRIYAHSDTDTKTDILSTVLWNPDRTMEPLLLEDFHRTMTGAGTPELQSMLISHLASLNVRSEADNFRSVMNTAGSSMVKRSAAEALGLTDSINAVPDLTKILSAANTRQFYLISNGYEKEAAANEKLAYSILRALENLHAETAYEAVFRTSRSSYSDKSHVRDRAARTLEIISENPTEILKKISDKEPGGDDRSYILSLETQSNASDISKVELAYYILEQSVEKELPEHEHYFQACSIIQNSPVKVSLGTGLEKIISDPDYSRDLKTAAIHAIANCDNSTQLFVSYLKRQNELNRTGLGDFSSRIYVTEVINTLGNQRDENAIEELINTKNSGWPVSVTAAADRAINNIIKN